MMKISSQLRDCATMIRRGWCQWDLQQGHRVCAVGAMKKVIGEWQPWGLNIDTGFEEPRQMARRWLMEAICGQDIVSWNNSPGQTSENVAQGFERAAELAEL